MIVHQSRMSCDSKDFKKNFWRAKMNGSQAVFAVAQGERVLMKKKAKITMVRNMDKLVVNHP